MDRVPKWEPKPGDVAMVSCPGINPTRATWAKCSKRNHPHAPHWHLADRETYLPASAHGLAARPLVVIDPDDREQVERLRDLMDAAWVDHNDGQLDFPARHTSARGNALQAALRKYANPKPPKPKEPQGLGAVVEDCAGVKWVRVEPSIPGGGSTLCAWRSRVPQDAPKEFSWSNIAAVRVLSDGVAADV